MSLLPVYYETFEINTRSITEGYIIWLHMQVYRIQIYRSNFLLHYLMSKTCESKHFADTSSIAYVCIDGNIIIEELPISQVRLTIQTKSSCMLSWSHSKILLLFPSEGKYNDDFKQFEFQLFFELERKLRLLVPLDWQHDSSNNFVIFVSIKKKKKNFSLTLFYGKVLHCLQSYWAFCHAIKIWSSNWW